MRQKAWQGLLPRSISSRLFNDNERRQNVALAFGLINMPYRIIRYLSIAMLSTAALPGLSAVDAMAQDDASVIDLNTAVNRSLADNPDLRAAGFQRQLQQARIEQAGIKPRPQLEVRVEDVFGSGGNDLLSGTE
ncbi:MAG: hypothetical protein WD601_12605, partial [Pseudohongiellaceae bacterium]